eukprot:GILK01009242.1.p1 GENE.GILK01009242.1~~GILK01009242.1.p1  ORF type:complete len:725 (-),score=61.45 GILK01009242.1:212-2386(-)
MGVDAASCTMATMFCAFEVKANEQTVSDICRANGVDPVAMFLPAALLSSAPSRTRRILALDRLTSSIKEGRSGLRRRPCGCTVYYIEVPLDLSYLLPTRSFILEVNVELSEADEELHSHTAAAEADDQDEEEEDNVESEDADTEAQEEGDAAHDLPMLKYTPLVSMALQSSVSTPFDSQTPNLSLEADSNCLRLAIGHLSIPEAVRVLMTCRRHYARAVDEGLWHAVASAHGIKPSQSYLNCMGPIQNWRRYVKSKYLTCRPMKIERDNLAGTCRYTTSESLDPKSTRLMFCQSARVLEAGAGSYSNCLIPLDPSTIVYISMEGEVVAETISAVADKSILWNTKLSRARDFRDATMTVCDGFIYVFNGSNVVYSLHRSTGAVRWEVELLTKDASVAVRSRLLPIEDMLLFVCDNRIMCVAQHNGSLQYEIALPGERQTMRYSLDLISLSLDASMLTAVTATGAVYVIDIDNRTLVRSHNLLEAEELSNGDELYFDATVVNGYLYGVAAGSDTDTPTTFFALDLSIQDELALLWHHASVDESRQWQGPFRPLVYEDTVICFWYELCGEQPDVLGQLSEYSEITAYNRLTGELRWSYRFYPGDRTDNETYYPVCPIIVNDIVHIGLINCHERDINYISLDAKSGTLLRHTSVQVVKEKKSREHRCLSRHPLVIDGVRAHLQLQPDLYSARLGFMREPCWVLSVSPLQILVCFNYTASTLGILQEQP